MRNFYILQITNAFGIGGSVTFALHLKSLLREMGHKAYIIGVGTNRKKIIPPFDAYMPPEQMIGLVRGAKCCISYGFKDEYAPLIATLGKSSRVPLFIHDPAEYGEYLLNYGSNVLSLRRTNQMALDMMGVDTMLLKMPHDYHIHEGIAPKNGRILSMQRLDARKKQHIYFEAIEKRNASIDVYGSISNMFRPYMYRVLDSKYPYWRNHYKGEFAGDKIGFIREYSYYVDMTYCENHGGFQYTNLECFAAGTPIMINQKFYEQDKGMDNVSLKNCLPVSDIDQILSLRIPPSLYAGIVEEGYKIAQAHHIKNKDLQEEYAQALGL